MKSDKSTTANALSAKQTAVMSVVVVVRKPFHSNENKISYGHWDCGQTAEKVS
jgi:hypothetical protein